MKEEEDTFLRKKCEESKGARITTKKIRKGTRNGNLTGWKSLIYRLSWAQRPGEERGRIDGRAT